MTRILASVRSLAEAQLLSECDIDILDLKEPGAGALGAVAPALAEAVVAQVDRRCRISAAAGVFGDSDLLSFVSALGNSGVDFVKIGFETPVPQEYLAALRAALPATVGAVAVLFVDRPEILPFEWLTPLHRAGFSGAMLDTAGKSSGTLADYFTPASAENWIDAAHEARLFCGLAGRLNADVAVRYLPGRPDYLGFRSALCRDRDRTAALCTTSTRRLLDTLRTRMLHPEEAVVDAPLHCLSPAQE